MIEFAILIILCGASGGYIAHRAGLSRTFGVIIGAIFNVLGVIFLLCLWGATKTESFIEPPEARP